MARSPRLRAKGYDPNPEVWVYKSSDTRSILGTELQQVLSDIEGEVRRGESREIVDLRKNFRP